jgi:hypothetical protein
MPNGQQEQQQLPQVGTEKEPSTYQMFRNVDPSKLREQLIKNRAEKQIYMNLDSARAANLMYKVKKGDLTYDMAVKKSKTMLSTPSQSLNALFYKEGSTVKDLERKWKTEGITWNKNEMNLFWKLHNNKRLSEAREASDIIREEAGKRRTQTRESLINRQINQNFMHRLAAQDIYSNFSFDIDNALEGNPKADELTKDLISQIKLDLGGEELDEKGKKTGKVLPHLGGTADDMLKSLFKIAQNIDPVVLIKQEGFYVDGKWQDFDYLEGESPNNVRMKWFRAMKPVILKARRELMKITDPHSMFDEEQEQNIPDPYNIMQYLETPVEE